MQIQARAPINYVICSTFRSGSWLLSQALENTGIAGKPREYLEPPQIESWMRLWGITTMPYSSEHLDAMLMRCRGANDVFGLKIHRPAIRTFARTYNPIDSYLATPLNKLVEAINSHKVIWLSRRDKVSQAVSWYKACESGIWWDDGKESGDLCKEEVLYRFQSIDEMVKVLEADDEEWRKDIADAHCRTLHVEYEELATDYETVVRMLLAFLDLPGQENVDIATPLLRKQANTQSLRWVELYKMHRQSNGLSL